MYKNKMVEGLEELYRPLGDVSWVNSNGFVFTRAKTCDLAIGGSIGMAIACKRARKMPGDIDLFNDNYDKSLAFLSEVINYLSNAVDSVGYRVQFNNNTKFTLPGVSHHIRIQAPFWKPICIMTLKQPLKYYFTKGGLLVQDYKDIMAAAETIEKIDGKKRINVPVCGRGGYTPLITTTEITSEAFEQRNIGIARAFEFIKQDRDVNGDSFLS